MRYRGSLHLELGNRFRDGDDRRPKYRALLERAGDFVVSRLILPRSVEIPQGACPEVVQPACSNSSMPLSSLRLCQVSKATSYRPLSKTPKLPVKFHNA